MKKQYRITIRELVQNIHLISSMAEIHLFLGRFDIPSTAKIVGKDIKTGDILLQED